MTAEYSTKYYKVWVVNLHEKDLINPLGNNASSKFALYMEGRGGGGSVSFYIAKIAKQVTFEYFPRLFDGEGEPDAKNVPFWDAVVRELVD